MEEIWRDIKGYEELYQVSNLGNVKSLKYRKTKYEHLLSQGTNKYGYKFVILCKNNKSKNFKVHRLVADAFIDNKCQYELVNHIDGNKQNNIVDNLEWCNYSQNLIHAYNNNLTKPHSPMKSKQVKCIETNKIYKSITEASKDTGFCINNISQCCLGKRKHTHNFHFCFV